MALPKYTESIQEEEHLNQKKKKDQETWKLEIWKQS
jgi:hypothetical protein